MSRNLLAVSKLEEFKTWLDFKGIQHRPGGGSYQVLQVRVGSDWMSVYERHNMTEHYTTDSRMDPLVRNFCRENRRPR